MTNSQPNIGTHDTQLSARQREALAADLESAEWFCLAQDIWDGLSPGTVLSRLEVLSYQDGEFTGDAATIIDAHITNPREPAVLAIRP
jgi:hypothetical protein